MVLVGYWPLNESSGSTAYDHSGNENHGTINDGGDSTVPGANGILGQNAYSFDGNNDYVNVGSEVGEGSSLTISAWIYLKSKPSSGFIEICTKPKVNAFSIYGDEGGVLHGNLGNGSSWDTRVNGSEVPTNEWVHVTGVYKSSDKIILYQNGKEDTARQQSTSIGTNSIVRGIGAKDSSGWQNHLNGRIFEVRVYNHVLTPQEVQYLYSVGKRGRQVTGKKKS